MTQIVSSFGKTKIVSAEKWFYERVDDILAASMIVRDIYNTFSMHRIDCRWQKDKELRARFVKYNADLFPSVVLCWLNVIF